MKGLDVAVDTLEEKPPPSAAIRFFSLLAGVAGGVSGIFGFGALAIELPLTRTVMLRSIAETGQGSLDAGGPHRLSRGLAFGAKRTRDNIDVGCYAARTLISKSTSDVATLFLEHGAMTPPRPWSPIS